MTFVLPGSIRSKKKQYINKEKNVKSNTKRVPDYVIVSEYKRLGNLWKVAESVGLCGQSVHERLVKLGIPRKLKRITKKEIQIATDYYKNTPDDVFSRQELLDIMPVGTTISRLEHIVTKVALGNKQRKHSTETKEKMKERCQGKPPPHNGFTGFHHTKESKLKISEKSRENWRDPSFIHNTKEGRERLAERARENGRKAVASTNVYSRCKRGYYDVPGRGSMYFRSKWEANYALYLQFLKEHNEITSWEYEARTFEFPVKKGCRFYTPDFLVIRLDGTEEHHEVKGWMDDKSKTKIKRMGIHHPNVSFVLIDERAYRNLQQYARLLKWY